LVGAVVAGVPRVAGGGSGSGGDPQLATASVQSFAVAEQGAGTVVPASEVAVNFTVAGQLSEIDVRVGQKVAQGAVLARLASSVPQSDVAKAQAGVAAADASLAAAEDPLGAGRQAQLQSVLGSDQTLYNLTVASVQATDSQDAAVLAADQQQLASDQQRLAADGCPAGVSSSNALVCQADDSAVTADQGRVAVDQARAQSDASEGQLRVGQAQSQVSQAQGAIAAASAPQASQVAAAQAAVSAANAQLQAAQAEVADLTLVAPSAGTVLQVNGQVGANVSGAATSVPTLPGTSAPVPQVAVSAGSVSGSSAPAAGSEPLVVLGTTGALVVGVAFPAGAAPGLAAGENATISADTVEGLSVAGRVLAVAPASTVVNGVPSVWASVIPVGPDGGLTDGAAVSVSVSVSQASRVLAVPQSAVYVLDGAPHVGVWSRGQVVATAVTTGMQGSSLVQITSGLNPGEQVVLSAYQGLPQTTTTSTGAQ
jgi:multidrug efflux pump subunit AcrA (membrane-fusion protein)